jgi:aryl-alcohol dehydrogenase-like predicted oxidoreductase
MKQRRIGPLTVSEIGLGCMNVSWANRSGTDPTRRAEIAIPGIHAALDAGITLLDTADIYAPTWDSVGHNEILVAEAVESWSGTADQKSQLVIATKGGITRRDGEKWGRDGSLDYLVRAAEASRQRLGVDTIALYQHHRLDPDTPLETQIENLGALKAHGVIANIGVSNYARQHLEVALDILGGPEDGGVVSVQNEFSPFYRHDADVLALCEERGIAFLPWSPLGGSKKVEQIVRGEFPVLSTMAATKGITVPRLVVAWLLHVSPVMVPLPGATRPESVADSAAATDVSLTADEVAEITASLPPSEPRRAELDPVPPRRERE